MTPPEDEGREWAALPRPVQPQQWVTFEDASMDPTPETTCKLIDRMCPTEEDRLPSLSDDFSGTAEMVDLTLPMEGDDCFSLSGNSDDTVDWSQAVGETLGIHLS